jgi:hypothetical protein
MHNISLYMTYARKFRFSIKETYTIVNLDIKLVNWRNQDRANTSFLRTKLTPFVHVFLATIRFQESAETHFSIF